MGNVSSRIDDSGSLFFKDQNRCKWLRRGSWTVATDALAQRIEVTISNITITTGRGRVLLSITPNSFPATRYIAKRDAADDGPIQYVQVRGDREDSIPAISILMGDFYLQDPDPPASAAPSFLLRLTNDEELVFKFTFIIRQTQTGQVVSSTVNGVTTSLPETVDTTLTGLTFVHASNLKELDNLITCEFHANPNLQNNENVQLIGDYSTSGCPSVQFDWSWTWKPPKPIEDKGGGWRNSCSFLDYDQRANRLNTLVNMSFWVQNTARPLPSPQLLTSPKLDIPIPARNRIPSAQSMLSNGSEADGPLSVTGRPGSPPEAGDVAPQPPPAPAPAPAPVKVDLPFRPGDDVSAVEDGPLFRATMKALEQKTGNMRVKIKKVLKKAEAAHQAQVSFNEAMMAFISALDDASSSNANAIQPAMEHYFENIARQILDYEQAHATHLQKMVIEPLTKVYNNDIKQAESKKKDFDEESRDFYAYVGRYLGQRQDSLKEKKRAESDSKYQAKRRNFELKRFDYSSFMQDLHGGRKEQEVLSHLTKYAEAQARSFLSTAQKVEELIPQLEALIREVDQAEKEFQFKRTEREEKRRALEKSTHPFIEPEALSAPSANGATESELNRADSTGSQLRNVNSSTSSVASQAAATSTVAGGAGTAAANRFRGIRDLEERDSSGADDKSLGPQRKEGLLWALSRPGSHIDPKGINKQAWHK